MGGPGARPLAGHGAEPRPALTRAIDALAAGNPAAALAPLREAAALHPHNPSIHHDLGLALLETGANPEAIAALRHAITLQPTYTDAHFRLGLALERAGDPRAAVIAFDRVTALVPTHAEAWYRAGALVFTLGHRVQATGCFERAAATGRKTLFGRLGQARALLAQFRDQEAERVLRHLLAREPDQPVAHDLLGNLLADAGRFAEARTHFAQAVQTGPAMAGTYYDLVRCRRLTEADAPLIAEIQAALATPDLLPEARIRLHLALGKAHDDLGDPPSAMRAFDEADTVRRTLMPFDAHAFDREVDRLIAHFARTPPPGPSRATPIFIIGMPRSGTTLTEQILSAHPQVAAGGELNFFTERGTAWLAAGPTPLDPHQAATLAADYLALTSGIAPKAPRVTDKRPFNFLWAGLIHQVFPDATLIHCRRAPIDTALSIHATLFNPRLAFPTGGEALVRYIRAYQRLTAHWRQVLPPDRFIEIDYEDLTRAPEPAIRRLVAACGLPWHDACAHPELNPSPVRTPSRWQARQPIYRDAVEKWRRYEPWLGPLRALLDA